MKKNSQIHIMIETDAHTKLKNDAEKNGTTLSEFCRQRMKGISPLDRIELKIDRLVKNLAKLVP